MPLDRFFETLQIAAQSKLLGAPATATARLSVFAAVATAATRATATFFLRAATAAAAARRERPTRSKAEINQTSDDDRSDNQFFQRFSSLRRAALPLERFRPTFSVAFSFYRPNRAFSPVESAFRPFFPFFSRSTPPAPKTLPVLTILSPKPPLNSIRPPPSR